MAASSSSEEGDFQLVCRRGSAVKKRSPRPSPSPASTPAAKRATQPPVRETQQEQVGRGIPPRSGGTAAPPAQPPPRISRRQYVEVAQQPPVVAPPPVVAQPPPRPPPAQACAPMAQRQPSPLQLSEYGSFLYGAPHPPQHPPPAAPPEQRIAQEQRLAADGERLQEDLLGLQRRLATLQEDMNSLLR